MTAVRAAMVVVKLLAMVPAMAVVNVVSVVRHEDPTVPHHLAADVASIHRAKTIETTADETVMIAEIEIATSTIVVALAAPWIEIGNETGRVETKEPAAKMRERHLQMARQKV